MKYLALILLFSTAQAQVESTILPLVEGVLVGAANGIAEGYSNDYANAMRARDDGAASYANSQSHKWRLVMRGGVVVSVGTAMLTGPADLSHAASRLALYSSSLVVAHHIGHSIQQGQHLTYAVGCYDCQQAGTSSFRGGAILGAAVGTVAAAAYITTCEDISTSCLATGGGVLVMTGLASWFFVSVL